MTFSSWVVRRCSMQARHGLTLRSVVSLTVNVEDNFYSHPSLTQSHSVSSENEKEFTVIHVSNSNFGSPPITCKK